jgi:modulator of FtsH protease HflK
MEKNPTKNAFTNLLILLASGIGAFVVSARGGSLVGLLTSIYCGVGVLVTIVSYLQMRHYRAEEVERLELDKVRDNDSSVTLFEGGEDVLRAKRAREQFEKYFIPAWTIMIMLLQGGAAYYLFSFFSRFDLREPLKSQALLQSAFFVGFALAQYLFGKYAVGLAQYDGSRMLRPSGSYLMLTSLVSVITAVVSVAGFFGFPRFDLHAAHGLTAVLALLAVENLINLIMEIYRPRTRGRDIRLLYESRLVGLLGQPGGIFKTVAHTLDYQFGFKVSETWFYRYVERAMAWLILLWVSVFLGSSCFVVLEPYEQALLERCGKPVSGREILEPGLHVKLPWPIDKVHRYSSRAVNQIHIGYVPNEKEDENPVLVWTKPHYAEEFNMLVASRDTVEETSSENASENAVPVNLMTASIPIQYQITDLVKWARNHVDGEEFLRRLASREIITYLVSVDVRDIMSVGRIAAAEELRQLIQSAADKHGLGAKISFVGLQDIHPPVKVAPAYEKVIGALQERETTILNAHGYHAEVVPMARAYSTELVLGAESMKLTKVQAAAAEGGQFANQIAAYSASPDVYMRRGYLKTLVGALKNARKYVLGTTNNQDHIWLNLEDTIGSELTEISFNEDDEEMRKQALEQSQQAR